MIDEHALQAARLLQDQRTVALRLHHDPAKAHRVHVAGFVKPVGGIERIALHIGRVVEKSHLRHFRRKTVEMPF